MDIYDKYIRTVNDFPITGIKFRDITPLLSNGDSFHQAIMDLNKLLPSYDKRDKIICAESRGFIFGAPLASMNNKGIVIARKPGKLPLVGLRESYKLEYGTATIEIPQDSIKPGDRVVILDDLIATGGSALAMKKLVERAGGLPILGLFLIELRSLEGYKTLALPCASIVSYGLHIGDNLQIEDGPTMYATFLRKIDEEDIEVKFDDGQVCTIKKQQIINIIEKDEKGRLNYLKYRD